MSEIEELNKQIETKRKEMYAVYEKNPNDPNLLKISQSLDKLLNQLDQMLKKT
ncbi:aspartyl-phosphate phosphatase Spo0E family protein [Oceanobacillus jeddahense]|uniref:Aspartyl-phosphate phosphatase Spo0E family protein n=1 Tax=Oceanobacillus jeddahense TaxID=1462527 RepID=A0ABY5JS98_9BACI|nr:aspartyl-phosphate phosphatase Spo0E family protein [Oceanobacillus jeddahense]UUI02307.1 aspartyl-phosphate phosphatase Spo0E family protein [Oceanobacillus jeddahense]